MPSNAIEHSSGQREMGILIQPNLYLCWKYNDVDKMVFRCPFIHISIWNILTNLSQRIHFLPKSMWILIFVIGFTWLLVKRKSGTLERVPCYAHRDMLALAVSNFSYRLLLAWGLPPRKGVPIQSCPTSDKLATYFSPLESLDSVRS